MMLKDLIGKTFYVTSPFSKNVTFKISSDYTSDWVYVDTWEGRSASTGRPMGRVKNSPYSVMSIMDMLKDGVISEKKV